MFLCFTVSLFHCFTKRFYVSCFSDSPQGNGGVLQLEAQTNCLLRQIYQGNLQHHHHQTQRTPKVDPPKAQSCIFWEIWANMRNFWRVPKKILVGKPDVGFAVRFALSLLSVADWSPIHDNALMPPLRSAVDAVALVAHCMCTAELYNTTLLYKYTYNTTLLHKFTAANHTPC